MIRRLEKFLEDWLDNEDVGPEEMGRTAPKVESLEESIAHITETCKAFDNADTQTYFKAASCDIAPTSKKRDAGTVVGQSSSVPFSTFKPIEPSRLVFVGVPSFDPVPYLDPHSASIFKCPLKNSLDPETFTGSLPHVRMHCSHDKKLELFNLLDSTRRLSLHRTSEVRERFASGMFSVVKSLEKDRLILDSRPANELEILEQRWVKSLASAESLTRLHLKEFQNLRFSGSDVRDFYYLFAVSEERCRRNILQGVVKPHEVSHLSCFREELWNESCLHAGLATLAMGDSQAVGLAQTCHLGLALQSMVASPETLLTLKGPLPRTRTLVGIVIDDFVTISKTSIDATAPSEGAQLADKMETAYHEVGLIPHKDKSFRDSEKDTFWGADCNGTTGIIRGTLRRAIPLMSIILQIERLGFATVEILQTIAGSLVSLFLFRRRLLSLLDAVFQSCSGRSARSIVKLSGRARGELLMMASLLPFAGTNLRAGFLPRVTASDASNWGEAGVYSEIPCDVSSELCRHALRRSVWAKLLPPGKAWERSHERLSPDLELPEDVEPFVMNPLWKFLATMLEYRLLYSRRSGKPRHINIGEVRSMLESERQNGFEFPSCRGLYCMDSQVALGCLGKGRSSSPSLNWELSRSLPNILGSDSYSELAYFNTLINPADAPTRGRMIPPPSVTPPLWWQDLFAGSFESFDLWLETVGLDSHSVSELPPFSELAGPSRTDIGPALSLQNHNLQADAADPSSDLTPELASKDICSKLQPLPCSSAFDSEQSEDAFAAGRGSSDLVAHLEPFEEKEKEADEASGRRETHRAPRRTCPGTSNCRPMVASPEKKMDLHFLHHLDSAEKKEVEEFILGLDPKQVHLRQSTEWPPTRPGFLDLYSGAKGVASALVSLADTWVVTYEINDGPGQDLNSKPLRTSIKKMIKYGLFLGWGAAPVCSSFSVAITPPVRNCEFPFGRPDATERMKVKMMEGNESASWLLDLAELSVELSVEFWLENPDLSWFFRLPTWKAFLMKHPKVVDFWRCDYCRFRKRWRKRTKFLTSTVIKGCSTFCSGGHTHIRLRGRSLRDKKSWTLVAQEYPTGVCLTIATSLLVSCGLLPELSNFNSSDFAGTNCRRLGEASHPGPVADRSLNLDAVQLIETRTLELQNKIWKWFLKWLHDQLPDAVVQDIISQPCLVSPFIKEFGTFLFNSGKSLYVLRHLVVFVQKSMIGAREHLGPCWALINKWEVVEPVSHRTPIPSSLVRAMVVVALHWKWFRFAGCVCLSFFGITRPGETLKACRRDLVLPYDLCSDEVQHAFLRISAPKARRRGTGRVQHATVENETVVNFLTAVFGNLNPDQGLYPISPSSFRRRWDTVLAHLGVTKDYRITPGTLRSGGAVHEYRKGTDLVKLLWRMRLRNLATLEHYIQEVAGDSFLNDLQPKVRHNIRLLTELFEAALSAFTAHKANRNPV